MKALELKSSREAKKPLNVRLAVPVMLLCHSFFARVIYEMKFFPNFHYLSFKSLTLSVLIFKNKRSLSVWLNVLRKRSPQTRRLLEMASKHFLKALFFFTLCTAVPFSKMLENLLSGESQRVTSRKRQVSLLYLISNIHGDVVRILRFSRSNILAITLWKRVLWHETFRITQHTNFFSSLL